MKQTDLNKNEKLTVTDSCGCALGTNDETKNTYDTNTLVKNVNLGTIQTTTTTCCGHQYKLVMMNGQYITYCERCGKIGDTRNALAPNYLNNNTVTTPGIVDVGYKYGYVTNPAPIKTTFENIHVGDYMTGTTTQHEKGFTITYGNVWNEITGHN